MEVLLTSVKPFDFTNTEETRMEGAKISYLGNKPSVKVGETGFPPMQITVKKELLNDIQDIPAIYDAEFEMVSGKNNKPELAITGFKYKKSVDLSKLFL